MFVKICGLTTEDDALLAVALGADALGFVFAPSTRQVTVEQVHDITRRLPPETLTIGVFRDELPDRVVQIVRDAGLKGAQLSGHEAPTVTREVHRRVRFVIQGFVAGSSALDHAAEHGADVILVDGNSPGSGQVFDWSLVDAVSVSQKLLLAGGLTPDNVAKAIERVRPWGVDVSSGVERSPGHKDPVLVKLFIDAAKAAAPTPYRGPDELPYDWMDDE